MAQMVTNGMKQRVEREAMYFKQNFGSMRITMIPSASVLGGCLSMI